MVGLTGVELSSSHRNGPRLLRFLQVAARVVSRSERLLAYNRAAVPRAQPGTLSSKPTRSTRAGTAVHVIEAESGRMTKAQPGEREHQR